MPSAIAAPHNPIAARYDARELRLGENVVLLAQLLLFPTLCFPLGRDQGVFTYVAQVMLRGGLPYRDVWEIKPPGIYLVYAGLVKVFGPDPVWLHVVDVVLAAVTAFALYRWVAPRWGVVAGTVAGIWLPALYLGGTYWSLAQAESFANPLLLGCIGACTMTVAACERRPATGWLVLAGTLAGTTVVLKTTAIAPVLPFLAWAAWNWRPEESRWPARFRAAAMLAVAVLAPVMLAVAWMRATGCLDDYIDIQRSFVAGYTRISGIPFRRWHVLDPLFLPAWALGAVGLIVVLVRRRQPWDGLLAAWFIAALAGVWVQRKFFGYHWTPVLPPLVALAGIGLDVALQGVARVRPLRALRVPRLGVAVGTLLALGWALGAQWHHYRAAVAFLEGKLPREQYLARFGRPFAGDYSALADQWVAEHLREHTRPNDPVFIWGFEPLIYVLANRRPPTRFAFNQPLTTPGTPDSWREELLRDLQQRPPEVFIVAEKDAIPHASGLTEDSATLLPRFPALLQFLKTNYEPETKIEHFTLYRRR